MFYKTATLAIIILLSFWTDLSRSFVEHQDLDEFREETLKVHNELRDIHNAEPLVLNKDLNRKASKIADIAASENRFHDLEAGENVFMACTTYNRAITGDEVTNAWYVHYSSKLRKLDIFRKYCSIFQLRTIFFMLI